VKPHCYNAALDLLHRHLDGAALILPVETAAGQGLFGPQPLGLEFRQRLGDILVLPYLGNFIWWRQPGLLENRYYGHHGGLTPQEVITVLGAVTDL
jgi:hypothetical protein